MPGLTSLTRVPFSKLSERKSSAYLIMLDDEGQPVTGNPNEFLVAPLRFQYFSESITDSKAINWNAREIPGASLPIYQWISSGERSVSFTAVFSSDLDLGDPETGGKSAFN